MRSKFKLLSISAQLSKIVSKKIRKKALLALAGILLICAIQLPSLASDVSTKKLNDTPAADNERSLGNKVSGDFKGYSDTSATNGGNRFSTTLDVTGGQAWPRISEGLTTGQKTKGYGISVDKYISNGNRYVSYTGAWNSVSTGKRYNGAYMWTNNANNIDGGDKNRPHWPWTTEINIWNRGTDIPPGTTPFPDYYDNDGTYKVSGLSNNVAGDKFYSYYFIRQGAPISNMVITTNKLLKHLHDKANLDGNQILVEISIAAEGHAGAKGNFTANINSMGRP